MTQVENARVGVQFHIKRTDRQSAEKFLEMLQKMGELSNVTLETTSLDYPVSEVPLVGSQKTILLGTDDLTGTDPNGTKFDPSTFSTVLKGA